MLPSWVRTRRNYDWKQCMSYGQNYLRLGKLPSRNVWGPLSSKQNHVIYIVGRFDLLHDRENAGLVLQGKWIAGEKVKMREFFLTLTIGAHENMNPVGETMKVERKLWSKPFAVPQSRIWELFNRKEWLSHVFTTAGLRQLNLFSSTLGMDGLPGDQNDTNWISIGIGWGICWVQKHAKWGSIMHERCERNPKRHTKVKESETLSETDGLCSTGLRGIACAGFMSRFRSSRQLLTTLFIH